MAQKLQQQLRDVGSKLENPPASKVALIKLLMQAANCLSEIDQSRLPSMLDSMWPCLNAIAKEKLLKHQDREVKVLVTICICEITRITAPEAPYSDDVLWDIFHLIVSTFSGLGDVNSPSFGRRVVILERLARYRSCVVMLDLKCNDLINEMFGTFFSVVSNDHPQNVLTSMQTIMVLILDESEDIQEHLLSTILSALGRKRNDYSMAARRLAMNVIEHCAGKLEPCIMQFLVSSMSGDNSILNRSLDYHELIYDLYRCVPQILIGIIPYITAELLPRDTCYVASEGLTELNYSGYQPHAYSWDDYPVLKDILKAVHEALPGSKFNSLLLNRYKSGSDYVAWHSDDERLYGPTPEIASVFFGCEREFLLRKKPAKTPQAAQGAEKSTDKRPKGSPPDHHGSLLVMRGYT